MSGTSSGTALVPAGSSPQLQGLQELPLPTPVSYAPQTIGWLFIAIVLLGAVLLTSWAALRRYRRQRYRRNALQELAGIEASLASGRADPQRRAAMLAAIPCLLKRTSLEIAPRDQVAALTGDAWLAFLRRTRGRFDAQTGPLLTLASYAPPQEVARLSPDDAAALIRHARDWIEHHHVEV
ncbi:hypothetical protein BCh11DRAFT_06667 [Burkholderia sp. Ch1-1]|uniref:DUF4381 domain-containing protein n=1 Tax=Paraburkholderia dioscoreae TaxID=2604047 RepID=A0A5Q4ZDH7_9BURK|nr:MULTISPECIES: DUF4381 domain-containing protein [Paraburkholderia]EIF31151.1 hypothetical protein BCh11DRAFT_06667 [Burkholderia sp. Ch1-1]MDR8401042.1 DUF4381 domain-containing protein [Paraburkholderia sp. USG1]VVD28650.1 conserved protein of unknown function [Paraburkholderia dioscoreae]